MKSVITLFFILFICHLSIGQNKTTSQSKPATQAQSTPESKKKVPWFETDISVEDLKKLKSEFPEIIILDIRPKSLASSGMISGAINLEWGSKEFASKMGTMDIKKSYIVYCADGTKSVNAQRLMKTHDFLNVANLKGGYKEYLKKSK